MPDLFIIEAAGKIKSLSKTLFSITGQKAEILATLGHICSNPEGLKTDWIDTQFYEKNYGVIDRKKELVERIRSAAMVATHIYIATDDDHEGDVIARDVLSHCINPEDHEKALRVRLRALTVSEVKNSINMASPIGALDAARGDARRIIDRLIGGLSNDDGAVGRVQGSLLLMLSQYTPVVGMNCYELPAADGRGHFTAFSPVYADDVIDGDVINELSNVPPLSVTETHSSTVACGVYNHGDVLLNGSLATGRSVAEIAEAMQRLYERGEMTYPRAANRAVTADTVSRIARIARLHGTTFNADKFGFCRSISGAYGHEAPSPLLLDFPLNRDLNALDIDTAVLALITRNLISNGIPCLIERPDISELPSSVSHLQWHRTTPEGQIYWDHKVTTGFTPWTAEQSTLHFMMSHDLGRPSTIVSHVEKFLERDLIDESFEFTKNGREWCYNIGEIFHQRNISNLVEQYLNETCLNPQDMVAEIINLCGLTALNNGGLGQNNVIDTTTTQQEYNENADTGISTN
ncbi:toprim domain-containing protein (plasmid) [Yersinia enterocolitica]|uniref:toprim domain-containing protein n=1 Tax=Yersinia enterocolitica TaxID=630 RepID=UPI0030D11694